MKDAMQEALETADIAWQVLNDSADDENVKVILQIVFGGDSDKIAKAKG